MRTKLLLTVTLIGFIAVGARADMHAASTPLGAVATSKEGSSEVSVTVNGMVCSFCAQGITKKFKARPDVEKVNVSLERHKVDLTLKKNNALTDQEIRKILQEAGYTVDKIERKPS